MIPEVATCTRAGLVGGELERCGGPAVVCAADAEQARCAECVAVEAPPAARVWEMTWDVVALRAYWVDVDRASAELLGEEWRPELGGWD